MTSWVYLLNRGAFAVTTDAMVNPLDETELSPEELLVRESIQNSLDERLENVEGPVRFRIEKKIFKGGEKRTIIKALALNEISKRTVHFRDDPEFKIADTCLASLSKPSTEISALVLSDHNTKGLGGVWNSIGEENRFHNLALSFAQSTKVDSKSDSILGSYGYGKMVYAKTSRIRLMAYYSVFEPTTETEHHSARFMATAFLPPHAIEHVNFTGHAFLGSKADDSDYPVAPYVDEEAHAMAERCGLYRRAPEDTGLTVLIIDSDLDIAKCREACEVYWWPRILSTDADVRLEVEIIDGETESQSPRARQNPDIEPFIQAWNNLHLKFEDPPGAELPKPKAVNPLKIEPGNLSLLRLEHADPAAPENSGRFANCVALMRGAGFVVGYENYAKEEHYPCIGVFVGSKLADKYLFLAEPPAHDRWIGHGRLKRRHGEDGARFIKAVHNQIRSRFREFQIRQEPEPEVKQTDGLDFLTDILGPIFKRTKGKREKPPRSPIPVSINTVSIGRQRVDGKIQDHYEVQLALQDDEFEEVNCSVKFNLSIRGDADGKRLGTVPCTVLNESGKKVADGDSPTIEARIVKGVPIRFKGIATLANEYKTSWTVQLSGSTQ